MLDGSGESGVLYEFETRGSGDSVKIDKELVHVTCGSTVCDVEHGDNLLVLVRVAMDHYRECGGRKGEVA